MPITTLLSPEIGTRHGLRNLGVVTMEMMEERNLMEAGGGLHGLELDFRGICDELRGCDGELHGDGTVVENCELQVSFVREDFCAGCVWHCEWISFHYDSDRKPHLLIFLLPFYDTVPLEYSL